MKVKISRHVERQLKKLKRNPILIERLHEGMRALGDNPYLGKDLGGELAGIFSYRVGDWRILYRIFKTRLIVLVVNIAHRKEVYR